MNDFNNFMGIPDVPNKVVLVDRYGNYVSSGGGTGVGEDVATENTLSELRDKVLTDQQLRASPVKSMLVDPTGQPITSIPTDLITDFDKGNYRRIKVDTGRETVFFRGQEFRMYKEFTIPAATTYVMKVEVMVDVLLYFMGVTLEGGNIRMTEFVGGTPSGSFGESLRSIPCNQSALVPAPAPVPSTIITAGGSHSGGTEMDVLRLRTASGVFAAQSTIGAVSGDYRGIAKGTYYIKIANSNASGGESAYGIFKMRWGETQA